MRPIFCICFLIITLACSSGQKEERVITADSKATEETKQLLALLRSSAARGIMFGHQDDRAYGIGWVYPNGESDVKKVCSDFPAVTGMDLGHLENESKVNLDSVPFADMKKIAGEIHSAGGIITFSWHCDNPLTGGSAWDVSSGKTVASVLPGGEKHEKYMKWLDLLATFFNSLTDDTGIPVPVIFRPYHEHTGSWFWWGEKLCSKDEFIGLWRFTVDYLCKTRNVHNLLFAYSGSGDFTNRDKYLERYPGDNYIDIMGFDYYQSGAQGKQTYIDEVKARCGIIAAAASEHNKVPALTETGFETVPDPFWWTGVLWPAVKDSGISYLLVWRNARNRPNHFYAPYPGQISEKDFIDFYNFPLTLFQKDIAGK